MAVEKEALFAEKRDDSNDERPMGQNRKKFTERKMKDLRFYILMMALPIIQFIIMYIGVNINSFLLSVKEYDLNTGSYKWLTGNIFQNFIDAFQEIQGNDFYGVIYSNNIDKYSFGCCFFLLHIQKNARLWFFSNYVISSVYYFKCGYGYYL